MAKYWGAHNGNNDLKPTRAKKHTADRTKREIAKFSSAYTNTLRMCGSGKSMEDISNKAMKIYSQNGYFLSSSTTTSGLLSMIYRSSKQG